MSDIKKNWLDKTGVIHLWNTIKALLDTKVDKIEGLGLSSNDYTVEDKTKVSKIKPVQNTLTSTDTEAGLSAAQGKVLKDIVDTKADNINVQPITIPTTGWGTENGVSAYPNYIDIPLAGVSSKDAVVIDISPSSAYSAAQAQFTNTESMDGAVRIRAKNIPTAAIKGQWYVIHGGGTVYEGDLHNYYDKSETNTLLAEKVGKDVILDSKGNVIFYSKVVVDKLLAGKLDLTGGAMTGELIFGNIAGKIYTGPNDAAYGPEEGLSNLVIESWNGISFAAADSHQVYYKKTAVGIDCRNSVVKAKRFEGVADNGIVAYGSNYVRFGDGTQICWGETGQIAVRAYSTATATITYPAAFASGYPMEVFLTIAGNSENDNYSRLVLHTTERRTTNCVIYFKSVASGEMNPIAQWLAIGRWK